MDKICLRKKNYEKNIWEKKNNLKASMNKNVNLFINL